MTFQFCAGFNDCAVLLLPILSQVSDDDAHRTSSYYWCMHDDAAALIDCTWNWMKRETW